MPLAMRVISSLEKAALNCIFAVLVNKVKVDLRIVYVEVAN